MNDPHGIKNGMHGRDILCVCGWFMGISLVSCLFLSMSFFSLFFSVSFSVLLDSRTQKAGEIV